MIDLLLESDRRTRFSLILLLAFFAIVIVAGGASRADALPQPFVRLAAALLIGVSLVRLTREEWRRVRAPVLFLLAIAALIGLQLVPLPPSIWTALPSRELYATGFRLAGVDAGWQPLTLTPDLTMNALLSVLAPLALLLGLASVPDRFQRILVPMLLCATGLSVALAIIQFSTGSLYFYRVTNVGSPVGLFANRNHQALLLSATLPLLACWAAVPHRDRDYVRLKRWIALTAAAATYPLLLITGSRAGLILGLVGGLMAAVILATSGHHRRERGWVQRLAGLAPLALGVIAVGSTLALARGEALDRLLNQSQEDARFAYLPTFGELIQLHFPWGSGFGSFDSVFRQVEPTESLTNTYLNHAHNDLAQILIEGGVPALALLLLFLLWAGFAAARAWLDKAATENRLLARTGSFVLLLILLSSLVDYPLRTPFFAVLAALSCYWMLLPKGGEAGAKRL